MTNDTEHDGNKGYPKWKFVFAGFALIGAFYVLREHYNHVLGFLPYLLLLVCPLMHLFGHGHHGGHGKHHADGEDKAGRP